ncbi:Zinc finger protein [Zancudomyces culisetae]|uniref:Zinc finger protein n=1 Tax=Zancudomyces culisetae TaxID=1213189 RepID=A0A1R1PQX6_ZANCU|nr:Zinc finger protein [Zancudomyces culisetae]|eukprot:OMH83367.1 Zinc finger protein [Zancudomyces culisetae]
MGRLRRSRVHKNIKDISKKYRTKRRTKDLDQIQQDLSQPEALEKIQNQEPDADLPGLGQHYCIECSKHFVNEESLSNHKRGKIHKKRVRILKEPAYTQKEAELAAGMAPQGQDSTENSTGSLLNSGMSSLLMLKRQNDVKFGKKLKKSMDIEL